MASVYVNLLTVALLPLLLAAGVLITSPAPVRVCAGIGLLGLCTLAAAGIAVYCAVNQQWTDLAITALVFVGITLEWDFVVSRITGRLPRLTLWLLGFRWASSTNRRRPPRSSS